jgi:chemotaxis protein CheC
VRTEAPLTEGQRDALRELANVGAGHAATALSIFLSGDRLAFRPPEVWTETPLQLAERLGSPAPWLALISRVQGDVRGTLWLVFGRPDAENFLVQLSAGPAPNPWVLEEALVRAAREAGLSAVDGIGQLTGLVLETQGPVLHRDVPSALGEAASSETELVVLGVRLQARGFSAQFLFLPCRDSVSTLLRSLHV